MTRKIVYSAALVAFIAAASMTLTAILLPNWISYRSPPDLYYNYGLHQSCSSISIPSMDGSKPSALKNCRPFPASEDCRGEDRYFCSLWRTTGFLMNAAAVLEMVVLVGFVVVLSGGKQKRESGWKLLASMLFVVAVVQCASMGLMTYLFDNDDRFFVGWKLDKSWILCTVSWGISMLAAVLITLSAYIFPPEDGYELIPSERRH